ncbi:hypothetical protein NDU88_004247 [Pleurodeles waltl]|uniref:Uncharacterized protein n=1 Tax=Pleurodeles waltl TaxID=8319 RepID=A0AAV7WV98_PLEWA|nr:hypothetical protein NDU88_004247 [Pleurodeles waltl]
MWANLGKQRRNTKVCGRRCRDKTLSQVEPGAGLSGHFQAGDERRCRARWVAECASLGASRPGTPAGAALPGKTRSEAQGKARELAEDPCGGEALPCSGSRRRRRRLWCWRLGGPDSLTPDRPDQSREEEGLGAPACVCGEERAPESDGGWRGCTTPGQARCCSSF